MSYTLPSPRGLGLGALLLLLAGCRSSGPGTTGSASAKPTPTPKVKSTPSTPPPDELRAARASSSIGSDEEVVVFPALGTWDTDGRRWRLSVHLWIFEPEPDSWRRAGLTKAIEEAIEEAFDVEDTSSREVLKQRVAPFLADNESGKRLTLKLGRMLIELPPSAEDGHIRAEIDVPLEVMPPKGGALAMEVVMPENDTRLFASTAHFITPAGRLLVSDIDDTVKVTNVRDKEALLRRTFLEEIAMVDGIGDGMKRLMGNNGHLHFLSASPYQLYPTLRSAFDDASLPPATYELKRWHPAAIDLDVLFADPVETKTEKLEALVARLPQRKWILIGDSGEKDPEVYGAFAREHASAVERIYIRDVTNEERTATRYQRAFKSVPNATWRLFSSGAELK